MIAVSCYWYIS